MERDIAREKHKVQIYANVLFCILAIATGICLYFLVKKQYRRVYRHRLKTYSLKIQQTIQDNEQKIGKYLTIIEILRKRQKDNQNEIASLKEETERLLNFNIELRQNSYELGLRTLGDLKQHRLIVGSITETEKKALIDYADLHHNNFFSRLKELYKLSDANLLLSLFLIKGFSTTDIAFAFDCERNSIKKKKQRLKNQLGLDSKDDLITFLQNISTHTSTP